MTLRPRPGVLDVTPYVGGESEIAERDRVVRLASNENPLGASPAAAAGYAALKDELHRYPDGAARELRAAIARLEGLDAARIVCGAGSDELIALLVRAYAGPGDEVLHSAHGFLMYRLSAMAAGATPVAVPERELTADVDALIERLSERTRLVFLANPNNPTGTKVDAAGLDRLAAALPPQALLVIDAAYAEYVREAGHDGGIGLVRARDNVVMTRTFSKIYGLAALRLGWAYAPEHVIDVLNRVRGPFNVTGPALACGEAAVRDRDYVEHCAVTNEVWRDWLAKELREAGFPVTPSHANFLLVETGARTGEADDWLKRRGLIARRVDAYGLPGHLRITVGDENACRAVAEAMREFGAHP